MCRKLESGPAFPSGKDNSTAIVPKLPILGRKYKATAIHTVKGSDPQQPAHVAQTVMGRQMRQLGTKAQKEPGCGPGFCRLSVMLFRHHLLTSQLPIPAIFYSQSSIYPLLLAPSHSEVLCFLCGIQHLTDIKRKNKTQSSGA